MQVVGLVTRFQATPKETHIQAVKSIFRYLIETLDFDIWYPLSNVLTLVAYKNIDWARSIDDRRSTSRATFFLRNFLVSWLRKKQSLVSLSTTKVKYIVAVACCA